MPLHAESGTKTLRQTVRQSSWTGKSLLPEVTDRMLTICCVARFTKINEFIGRNFEHLTSSALCSLASLLNHETFLLL